MNIFILLLSYIKFLNGVAGTKGTCKFKAVNKYCYLSLSKIYQLRYLPLVHCCIFSLLVAYEVEHFLHMLVAHLLFILHPLPSWFSAPLLPPTGLSAFGYELFKLLMYIAK